MAHAYENSGRMKEAADQRRGLRGAGASVPHAVHMHGHELRRLGRINEAIARFEAADKLQRDYMAREKIAAELDWHHAHNLDLLAASYQYTGQMKKAETLLKQSFNLPTNLLVQAVNKREWPAFLVARNRPAEAVAAAQVAARASQPRRPGHRSHRSGFCAARDEQAGRRRHLVECGVEGDALGSRRAGSRRDRARSAARRVQLAHRAARQGPGDDRERREEMAIAAGPDAWSQSLFRLEALARSARAVGDWSLAARLAQLMLEHDSNYAGTHLALALVSHHNSGTSATTRREFASAKAWANADKDLPELKAIAELRK